MTGINVYMRQSRSAPQLDKLQSLLAEEVSRSSQLRQELLELSGRHAAVRAGRACPAGRTGPHLPRLPHRPCLQPTTPAAPALTLMCARSEGPFPVNRTFPNLAETVQHPTSMPG